MSAIKHAVGPGQPNDPTDVRTVQRLLNAALSKLIPLSRLVEDGQFGSRTEFAIREFQRRVVKMHAPDGTASPNGGTIRALGGATTRSELPYVTKFINMALPAARDVKKKWNVPVAVTLAQSAQETGWGRHVVGDAYFGIKGHAPSGDSTTFATTEVVDGKVMHIDDQFRAYTSYADAADDYGRFLSENERYSDAFKVGGDPYKFIDAIAAAGYATDPHYAQSLKSIIRSHKLDQYDK